MKRLPIHEETAAEQAHADLLKRMRKRYNIRSILILLAVIFLFGALFYWLKSSGVLLSIL